MSNINIASPTIEQEEIDAVINVMKTGVLAQGPEVFKFEQEFAKYIGVKYAVATSNGSTALLVTLLALLEQRKVKQTSFIRSLSEKYNPYYRGEVITTPFTFLASASSILLAGLRPVFVDIEEDTFCINPQLIEKAITSRTVAIMPVQLYGNVSNMDRIMEISKKYNVPVVEDCAQSHGSLYKGRSAGSIGTAGCFSFYPTKNMTTGEGGIITTDDEDLANKCRLIRAHGMSAPYQYDYLGFNYRMTSIGAAIGRAQLLKLDGWNTTRIMNAEHYNSLLGSKITPYCSSEVKHVYHQYTIRCPNPSSLQKYLQSKGIGSGVYYPAPLYDFEIMKKYKANCPITESVCKQVLSLPVHPKVTPEDIDRIAKEIIEWFKNEAPSCLL